MSVVGREVGTLTDRVVFAFAFASASGCGCACVEGMLDLCDVAYKATKEVDDQIVTGKERQTKIFP